jgi:hypothetical protein
MGHCDDVIGRQPEAFRHLAEAFYRDGTVDDSEFRYQSVDFTPSRRLPDMAKKFVGHAALIGGGTLVCLIVITAFFIRRLRLRKKGRTILQRKN